MGKKYGKHWYLHHFLASDPDRGLHTHKWFAWSIVLLGWYWEQRRWGFRKIRWINFIDPDTAHRVVLPRHGKVGPWEENYEWQRPKSPCWTLFFHNAEDDFPDWGFEQPVEGHPGARLFVPYDYSREGKQTEWWLTAPRRPAHLEMPT